MMSRNTLGKTLATGILLLSQSGCMTVYTDLDSKMSDFIKGEDVTESSLIIQEEIPETKKDNSAITEKQKTYLDRPEITRVNMKGEYPIETMETMQTLGTFTHGTELNFFKPVDISKIKIKNKFDQNQEFYFIQSVPGNKKVTLDLYTLDKNNSSKQPISREQIDMSSNNLIVAKYSLKIPAKYAIVAYDEKKKTLLGNAEVNITKRKQ